jgi:spore cortex formation protein SpoVR/YcgB (stage V sporulation)
MRGKTPLVTKEAASVVNHAKALWGYPVKLESYVAETAARHEVITSG